MTVSTSTNRVEYSGNGATTAFPYEFRVFEETDLVVSITDAGGVSTVQTLNTDYTVANGASSGTVTMTVAPASGETLLIRREVPLTQDVDMVDNDPFSVETVEAMVDRAVILIQQIQDRTARAVALADDFTGAASVNLTVPAPEPDKVLAWNGDGTVLVNGPTTAGLITLEAIAADITTAAGIAGAISTVAADGADIGAVAGITANVTAVAAINADVVTLAAIEADVTTAAGNATAIAAVASEIGGVGFFFDRYQVAATAPTTRADGSALKDGDLWWNSANDEMYAHNGTGFEVVYVPSSGFLVSGDIGVSVQAHDPNTLKADTADQLTAGFTSSVNAVGNSGTGTHTVNHSTRGLATLTVSGSFTFAPDTTGNGRTLYLVTNDGTGGHTLTTSGWGSVIGTYNSAPGVEHLFECLTISSKTILRITDLT